MSIEQSASIYGDYINITKTYQQKYGSATVLLMQVGAFFEVYGFKCPRTGDVQDSAILEFSQICNLNISEKKVVYEGRQVLMAGFRDYTLDKYLQKITEQGYTAVVYVQDKSGKTITRVLDSVHSAGTYVSYETDNLPQMTNNIMCVWIDVFKPTARNSTGGSKTRDSIVCGIAVANTFTGKSTLSEFQHSFEMNPTTFDDLERAVIVNNPSEVILVSGLSDQIVNSIVQFSGIRTSVIHRVSLETSEKAVKCAQQKYVQHVLDTFYGEESLQTCGEFSMYPTATQAFCYLLDFVQEHNPNLVKKIAVPGFQSSKKMLLANHTLKQLNILDDANQDGKKKGHLASVATFLNKCCTAMGKRKFQSQLVAPTTDIDWLNQEYAMTARMLEPTAYDMMDSVRKILGQIRDIEKICRQIVLRKIYPSSIYHLYESVLNAHQLAICFAELPEILESLGSTESTKCVEVLGFLDENLYMDRCKLVSSWQNLEESVVKPGVCLELDEAVNSYQKNVKRFNAIHAFFNRIMRKQDPSDTTEYVKVHETEKSGVTLQITKKRGTTLKAALLNMDNGSNCQIPDSDISISVRDVKFISASASSDELDIPILSKICKEMIYQKETLNRWNIAAYHQVLTKFENEWYTALEQIAEQIAKLDVLQSKAFIAKTYHYCKPEIINNDDSSDNIQSFVDARDLRHCLIEHIQQNEIYVPNDVSLGLSHDGILLYGTNAVGKTSLIRALGIAVIMAQAGLYVPCSKFTYKPYTAIFSRILGNDNLFKGLSTFAVEMSELRIILKMADNGSLILGDELCSGTEMESALSIFVAGLQNLHSKRASFVFATHFHEIIGYDEIKALNKLALKHMAVLYDRELDALIYDRKLCDGPGTRMYGLEVCKSLHLEDEFLEQAYSIRAKYFAKSELDHQASKYNTKKIRGLCELCKTELGEEIHHLDPQKNSDQDGFIGTFHKNHPANLMTVCEKCHNDIHSNGKTTNVIRKKSTKGYIHK